MHLRLVSGMPWLVPPLGHRSLHKCIGLVHLTYALRKVGIEKGAGALVVQHEARMSSLVARPQHMCVSPGGLEEGVWSMELPVGLTSQHIGGSRFLSSQTPPREGPGGRGLRRHVALKALHNEGFSKRTGPWGPLCGGS